MASINWWPIVAKSGTHKWFSLRQEDKVAKVYGGIRSPSSGAAFTDQGDVRTNDALIECKHAGTFAKPAKSIKLNLDDLEKIADEAWSESKEPMMVLSIYAPDSVLADKDGEVNVSVRLMSDDVRGHIPAQLTI